jgi:RHS repeat-associated protein
VTFTYNGDGVRVGKSVNGSATDYVQDLAGGLPMVLADGGATTNRYVYGNDRLAQVDLQTSYFHADGLGRTRRMSNGSGQAISNYVYDGFGATRVQATDSSVSYRYTGEQADDEIALQFLRARYYEPTIGRFMSIDPDVGYCVDTSGSNPYIYVRNNPVRLVDPVGRFPTGASAAIRGSMRWVVETGSNVAGKASKLLGILGGGQTPAATTLGALSDIGGAVGTGYALSDLAKQATRDENTYWKWRYYKSLYPDRVPTQDNLAEVEAFYEPDTSKIRAMRDLGEGTISMFGSSFASMLFPMKWRKPENDREYQDWLRQIGSAQADIGIESGNWWNSADWSQWRSSPSAIPSSGK